jgi:hypothetical protein
VAKRPDDELILHFYGEHSAPEEIDRELAADPELALRYKSLRRELRVLDELPAPEPRPGLEGRMWARVAPALTQPSRRRVAIPTGWFGWAALSTAVLVVALVGFLAGRSLRPTPTESNVAETLKALPPAARDRVLQAALADHLDSSQRLLLEVANGTPSLQEERAWAETLLSANRLYRRAAERAGQRRVAAVLGELEPFLTQLAEAPASFDLRRSQERIESGDLLFKVRITRNNLKELS